MDGIGGAKPVVQGVGIGKKLQPFEIQADRLPFAGRRFPGGALWYGHRSLVGAGYPVDRKRRVAPSNTRQVSWWLA